MPASEGPHAIVGAGPGSVGGEIRLSLDGGPSGDFADFSDLFLLETSTNLVSWGVTRSILVPSTTPRPVSTSVAVGAETQFFRTPAPPAPTALPKPTGPHGVGTVSRLFSSATRNSTAMGTNREFMVSIHYPAAPAPYSGLEHYIEPIWMFTPPRGVLFDKQYLDVLRPLNVPTNLVSHALVNAPLEGGTNQFPVLLYSHGGQYFRRDNVHKCSELASHGFVVVSIDYYDAFFSVLPDGTPAVYDPVGDFPHINLSNTLNDFSVLDAQFALDQIGRMAVEDPQFHGRLDLRRIGCFGWSFGGATAANLLRIDSRVTSAVLYDAAFWAAPATKLEGLQRPFLCMNSADPPGHNPGWYQDAIDLVQKASTDAMFFQFAGSYHYDFTDMSLIDYPTPAQQRLNAAITAYTVAFFRHYLMGTTEPLLNAPPPDGTVVNWIKK